MFGKDLIGFFATLPKRPLLGTRQWLRPVSKLRKVELDCNMISLTLVSLDKLNIKLCVYIYINHSVRGGCLILFDSLISPYVS